MEITPIGYLLIPLGLTLFFLPKHKSFFTLIFFVPFFSVVVFKIDATGTLVKAFQFFSLIFFIKNLNIFLFSIKKSVDKKTKKYILLFTAIIIISLIMPFIYAGEINRVSMNTSYSDYFFEPLKFTLTNITQLFYPLSMIAVFFPMSYYFSKKKYMKKAFKILFISIVIVFISGILYQITLTLQLNNFLENYFYFLTGDKVYRSLEFLFGHFPRMYSLAGEPGYTSMLFLISFAFSSLLVFSNYFNHSKIIALMIISFLGIVFSGGTTGIFGLLIYFLGLLLLATRNKKMKKNSIKIYKNIFYLIIGISFSAFIVSWLTDINFISWLVNNHIMKMEGQGSSGVIRAFSMEMSINIFEKSPLLGIGYGSHRALQLLFSLMTNVGIIGTTFYLLFNYSSYSLAINSKFIIEPKYKVVSNALGITLFSYVLTSLLAKSIVSLTFPWYWIILSSIQGVNNRQKGKYYDI